MLWNHVTFHDTKVTESWDSKKEKRKEAKIEKAALHLKVPFRSTLCISLSIIMDVFSRIHGQRYVNLNLPDGI